MQGQCQEGSMPGGRIAPSVFYAGEVEARGGTAGSVRARRGEARCSVQEGAFALRLKDDGGTGPPRMVESGTCVRMGAAGIRFRDTGCGHTPEAWLTPS